MNILGEYHHSQLRALWTIVGGRCVLSKVFDGKMAGPPESWLAGFFLVSLGVITSISALFVWTRPGFGVRDSGTLSKKLAPVIAKVVKYR